MWRYIFITLAECQPLDDIECGSVSMTTNRVLGVATYSCIGGYSLTGGCERVCLENAEWTGTEPVCLPTGMGISFFIIYDSWPRPVIVFHMKYISNPVVIS